MPQIDALVSLQGVCCSDTNERHQLTGFTLDVPGLDCLTVLEPPLPDPFSIPTTSSRAVARFDPGGLPGRRIKLTGTVTLTLPGQGFFLQDELGGIRVFSIQTTEVRAGDVVDVLGFPAIDEFAPRLEQAVFRRVASRPLPPPRVTTAEDILTQASDDSLRVQLEAQLLKSIVRSAHPKLVLQSGSIIFTAKLVGENPSPALLAMRPGSLLRLTGVCSLPGRPGPSGGCVSVLIRRAADVHFLKAPPLSTGRQALLAAALMAFLILAAFGWVGSLRRQVRRQTAAIHEEKNLLATLIDHLPDNVYVKDLQGRYLLTNLAHTSFHGASSPAHFRGKSVFELFPPHQAQAYAGADAQVLSGRTPVLRREEEILNGAGIPRLLATTKVPLRDATDHIVGLVGISRDITETKRAESELREQQRALSTLLSNLPGLAYRCRHDQNRTMEFLSEGVVELTGYAPAELVGNQQLCYAQLIHPEDRQRVFEEIELALHQHGRFQLLYRIITRGGPEKHVSEQGLGIFSPKAA